MREPSVVQTVEVLRASVRSAKAQGGRIGFVPTMGALHDGHLSLVEIARQHSDFVVMSIFVNAAQFNSAADLQRYPREIEKDCQKAKSAGVDLVFAPSDAEIYPKGIGDSRTVVRAGSTGLGLCGAARPGHFDGVVTVVSLLFNIVEPDVAVFGEKDFQQLKVIEQMVRDLHYAVEVVPGPLVRDEDGLALSSRNALLSPEGRNAALAIPAALFRAKGRILDGEGDVEAIRDEAIRTIEESGRLRVDYVSVVDTETLEPLSRIDTAAQLLIAAFVDDVRLIDNIRLEVPVKDVVEPK